VLEGGSFAKAKNFEIGSADMPPGRLGKTMLSKLTLLALLFAVPLVAQEPNQSEQPKDQAKIHRRLESLTWNPVTGKLTWAVSQGTRNGDGEYVPNHEKLVYEIDLPQATMAHNGSQRRFSPEEASNVMAVMELISKYAQDSTVWWETGKGDPLGTRVKLTAPEPSAPLSTCPATLLALLK